MAYNKDILENLKDLKEIQALSDIERKELEKILTEYSNEGKSETYNALIWNDYEEIPVDVETFLKDPRYLGRGLIDEEGRFTVFPYWVETMKKLFPTNIDTAYNTLILTGSIGIGKTFFGDLCILYMLHRLLCLKDPYTHFGLQPIDKISISLLNAVSKEAAKGVAWDKLQQLIQTSEWFMAHGTIKGRTNIEFVPDKKIELIAGSRNSHVIGRAIFSSLEDEINFSAVTTNVERIKEKALKLITQVDARMQSRFMKGDKLPTLHIIVSSKDSEQSFLETYIDTKKNNNSKTTLIIDEPQWVIRTDKNSDKHFYVAVGNKFLASDLLPLDITKEKANEWLDKGYQKILEVPIGYYENFVDNIDIALTDIAGISTVNALKYISGTRWKEIKNPSIQNLFTKDIIEVGNAKEDTIQYNDFIDLNRLDTRLKSKPLFIHLDMSTSGDKTGIAGVWIAGKKASSQNSSKELFYQLAFSVSIKAPKGYQISFEKNRNFIRWLRKQGFNISGVSSDTFQSAQIQQQLKADDFDTCIISVDRVDPQSKVCLPYQYLQSTIYEHRLTIYEKCDLLTEEVVGLERLSSGKIEHPDAGKSGSKDQIDAVTGALYNASQHAEEFAYDYGEDLKIAAELSTSISSSEEHKKQVQVAFEQELQRMFGKQELLNNKSNQPGTKAQQEQREKFNGYTQEELEKSNGIQLTGPKIIDEQAKTPVIIQGDMIVW